MENTLIFAAKRLEAEMQKNPNHKFGTCISLDGGNELVLATAPSTELVSIQVEFFMKMANWRALSVGSFLLSAGPSRKIRCMHAVGSVEGTAILRLSEITSPNNN